MKKFSIALVGGSVMLAFAAMVPTHAAVDAGAAQALAKKNDCFKLKFLPV